MAGSEPQSEKNDVFDVRRIRQLVQLMEQHDLSQIDLRHGQQRIRLRRGSEPVLIAPPVPPAPPPASGPPAAPAAPAASPPAASEETNIVVIKSPMVGTFYGRPNPESEAFVKVGDAVTPETTVCIIEAMKVFNEIPAEVSGRIVAVLAEDEEPVEFGKPLFRVQTGS
jgi:acetyl-CoA carboxylase biotin carboxyl carrier protein